ncbi:MAG: hypothetical protein U9O90_11135 [Euryarchaeota archaeon]|nr:hypothetical protein [Euryarchaeota archaeon]
MNELLKDGWIKSFSDLDRTEEVIIKRRRSQVQYPQSDMMEKGKKAIKIAILII